MSTGQDGRKGVVDRCRMYFELEYKGLVWEIRYEGQHHLTIEIASTGQKANCNCLIHSLLSIAGSTDRLMCSTPQKIWPIKQYCDVFINLLAIDQPDRGAVRSTNDDVIIRTNLICSSNNLPNACISGPGKRLSVKGGLFRNKSFKEWILFVRT